MWSICVPRGGSTTPTVGVILFGQFGGRVGIALFDVWIIDFDIRCAANGKGYLPLDDMPHTNPAAPFDQGLSETPFRLNAGRAGALPMATGATASRAAKRGLGVANGRVQKPP